MRAEESLTTSHSSEAEQQARKTSAIAQGCQNDKRNGGGENEAKEREVDEESIVFQTIIISLCSTWIDKYREKPPDQLPPALSHQTQLLNRYIIEIMYS